MKPKRKIGINEWVSSRIYISEQSVHYAGGLVHGGYVITQFGDVGNLLMVMFDGDEGLLAAYKSIDLLEPIRAGQFLELKAKVIRIGNTSRDIALEAWCIAKPAGINNQPSAVDYLDEPILVARAELVSVVRKEFQRYQD